MTLITLNSVKLREFCGCAKYSKRVVTYQTEGECNVINWLNMNKLLPDLHELIIYHMHYNIICLQLSFQDVLQFDTSYIVAITLLE